MSKKRNRHPRKAAAKPAKARAPSAPTPTTPSAGPAARFWVLMGKVFFSLLILIACVIGAEAWSRKYKPLEGEFDKEFPREVTRIPHPYIMFKGQPRGRLYQQEWLNQNGYRGPAPTAVKPDGEYRIFILGGSTVFNGFPAIGSILQPMLNQNGYPTVKVFNYGVISSLAPMELARVTFEVSDYEPDLIIFYNGANDIHSPVGWDPRPGFPFNYQVYENNPFFDTTLENYPAIALGLYGSNLARTFGKSYFEGKFGRTEPLRKATGYLSNEWREEIARTYVNTCVKAGKVARGLNSDFVVFLQPAVSYKDHLTEEEKELNKPVTSEQYLYGRERILAKYQALSPQDTFAFVDLTDLFDPVKQRVFADHVHIGQPWKAAVAQQIAQVLVRRGNLPAPAGPFRQPGPAADTK